MSTHKVRITGGPGIGQLEVELDGRRLQGCRMFKVWADARGPTRSPCRVELVLMAEVDIEVEADTAIAREEKL